MFPTLPKDRLDALIRKARADLYKPIAVAEILHRQRTNPSTIDLLNRDEYRRKSHKWMSEIILRLHNKTPDSNSRYWDQLFDAEVLPPAMLNELGILNSTENGIVEVYIYGRVRQKFEGLAVIREWLATRNPSTFSLAEFLGFFEKDERYRRSVDKAYEIVVYALFNAVTQALGATITLSVASNSLATLRDFEDFARVVLGVDSANPSINQPARLFRVGTANANDAGLDMWANFGPAVQVKHISLSPDQVGEICADIQADQVIIVCKSADATTISVVLQQLGLNKKLRAILTEIDLTQWYLRACAEPYQTLIGEPLLQSLRDEMRAEFPLSDLDRIEAFFEERGYDRTRLSGEWRLDTAQTDDTR